MSGLDLVGKTIGLFPAVGISPLLFSFTDSDCQFPVSVPNSTLVGAISVAHVTLTSYPLSRLVFFSLHTLCCFEYLHFLSLLDRLQ